MVDAGGALAVWAPLTVVCVLCAVCRQGQKRTHNNELAPLQQQQKQQNHAGDEYQQ